MIYVSTKQNEKWKLAFLDFSKGTLSSSDPSFEIHLEDGVIAIGEILLLDITSFMGFQIDVLESRLLIGREWWTQRQFENKPEYPVAVVVDVIVDGACLVDGAVEFDTTLAGANFFSILN